MNYLKYVIVYVDFAGFCHEHSFKAYSRVIAEDYARDYVRSVALALEKEKAVINSKKRIRRPLCILTKLIEVHDDGSMITLIE